MIVGIIPYTQIYAEKLMGYRSVFMKQSKFSTLGKKQTNKANTAVMVQQL
jgi:hypothetical protein